MKKKRKIKMALPEYIKKRISPVEAITGAEESTKQKGIKETPRQTKEPVPETEEFDYRPTEYNRAEIDDIGDQLADYILEFVEKYGSQPIPGDMPIQLNRAAELTNIGTTGTYVGHILLKQIECDALESVPWWIKHLQLLILTGFALSLPVLLLVIANYGLSIVK